MVSYLLGVIIKNNNNMETELLIKFICGEADNKEITEVLDWADKDEKNKHELIELQLTYLAVHKENTRATSKELDNIKRLIKSRRVKGLNYKIFFYIASSVAVIALFFLFSMGTLKYNNYREKIVSEVVSEVKNQKIQIALNEIPLEFRQTIYTEKGVKSTLYLPDSSEVILNSDSKLIFPDKFIGDTREVYLNGEAYFKVRKDSNKPMIVSTNKKFKIQVTGTEFNVKSYDNDDNSITTLYSGSINMITANGTKRVHPNEQVSIDSKNHIRVFQMEDKIAPKAWTEGRLLFDVTPMPEVIKILERWHGVNIIVRDSSILHYKITAEFKSESISQIMYVIKNCALIDYTIVGKDVTLLARRNQKYF